MGLYTHVIDQEVKCKKSYTFFTRLINVCLGLQLIVAATLTAIGAANGSRAAITVFGALNTVLAGIMTFLKGSGLPNRLKYYQHEWASLREYVEQRERDIVCGYDIDIQQEVEAIRKAYEAIKSDIEANTPDRFVSNTRNAGNPGTSTVTRPTPSRSNSMMKLGSEADSDAIRQSYMQGGLAKPKSFVVDRTVEVDDMEKRIESFVHDRQRDVSSAVHAGQDQLTRATSFASHLHEDLHGLRAKLHNKRREITDLEKELEHRGSSMFNERREDVSAAASQFRQAGVDARAGFARAASQNEAAARNAFAQSAEAASAALEQRQQAAIRAVDDGVGRARGFAHETVERSFEGLGQQPHQPLSQPQPPAPAVTAPVPVPADAGLPPSELSPSSPLASHPPPPPSQAQHGQQ